MKRLFRQRNRVFKGAVGAHEGALAASLTPGPLYRSLNSAVERVGFAARRTGSAASGQQAIEIVYHTHQSIALESAASRS
jgi:hypothetical protein